MFIHQGRQLLSSSILIRERLSPLLIGWTRHKTTCSWNYDTEKKNFRLIAPTKYNFARDVIDKWADKEKNGERGSNPAFWWMNESGQELKWSFQDISYQSKLVANVLLGPCQLQPDDVVIVILPRIPQWWVINVAAIRAGVILSPGTTLLRSNDIKYRVNASNAKCIITNEQCADLIDEVWSSCPSLKTKVIVSETGSTRNGWLDYNELVRKSTDYFECCDTNAQDPMTIFSLFQCCETNAQDPMTIFSLFQCCETNAHNPMTIFSLFQCCEANAQDPMTIFSLFQCCDTNAQDPMTIFSLFQCCDTNAQDPMTIFSLFQCCDTNAQDPMTIFFTSGTTGAPKMTEHSHCSYGLGHVITARYFLDLTPSDIFWNLSDTGWAKCAWSSLFAPWIAGSCVFVQDVPKFDPLQTVQILASKPISVFCAPPTAARFMQNEPTFSDIKQTGMLRHCVCGGEPVNPEMLEEWEEGTGHKLYEGYGQTETTFLCGTYPNIEQRPGSMGKPAPGYDLQVVDESGMILPRGKEGNIGIKCKPERPVGLFTRYIDDEERMKNTFAGDYYLTGDRAIMDDDDYVWFIGRDDDVIITSGYRIGPFEVESALLEHPAVLESAVVSSPDKDRGEIIKAFVMLTEDYQNADKEKLALELQDHTKKVTAPYKYPRKIEFVDVLPKTVSGKIRRVELRNNEWGRTTSD
ncbi:Acyl-coenzyme A synthetase acsm3 [Mactra antiquata]